MTYFLIWIAISVLVHHNMHYPWKVFGTLHPNSIYEWRCNAHLSHVECTPCDLKAGTWTHSSARYHIVHRRNIQKLTVGNVTGKWNSCDMSHYSLLRLTSKNPFQNRTLKKIRHVTGKLAQETYIYFTCSFSKYPSS